MARYSFPVGLFHPLPYAGLSRRSARHSKSSSARRKASEGAFVSVELVDAAGKRRLLPVSDFGQAGRSYSELIPAGVPFRLEVASQKFQLAEIASVPGSTRVTNGRFELPVTASVRTVQATTKRRTMFDRRLPEPAISVKLKVEGRKP